MSRRFWQFAHDKLESAWHWVYYHKLAPQPPSPTSYSYSVVYLSETGTHDVPWHEPKRGA